MSSDLKNPAPDEGSQAALRDRGVRIFTYPKIVFMFPTLIMSLICAIGMYVINPSISAATPMVSTTKTADGQVVTSAAGDSANPTPAGALPDLKSDPKRFKRPENLLGFMFLGVLAINLFIMAIDFPRFTILAVVLLITTVTFFLLWLGMFVNFLDPLFRLIEIFYVEANAQFYLIFTGVLLLMYAAVYATRWLDYWEIMPNEILHHHGPLSDLERYPTMNLKFDKEIPDIFEHMMGGAGRLVLNLPSERRSIVLDTVFYVSRKEAALKALMSRMEVRVTTDTEAAAPQP